MSNVLAYIPLVLESRGSKRLRYAGWLFQRSGYLCPKKPRCWGGHLIALASAPTAFSSRTPRPNWPGRRITIRLYPPRHFSVGFARSPRSRTGRRVTSRSALQRVKIYASFEKRKCKKPALDALTRWQRGVGWTRPSALGAGDSCQPMQQAMRCDLPAPPQTTHSQRSSTSSAPTLGGGQGQHFQPRTGTGIH